VWQGGVDVGVLQGKTAPAAAGMPRILCMLATAWLDQVLCHKQDAIRLA
jgi:hypothetical protein